MCALTLGPRGGHQIGATFFTDGRAKATASSKWVNLLRVECPPGRRVIHLNMDETSLRLALPPEKGYQARPFSMTLAEFRCRRQMAPLAQRRAAMSYIAVFSDADDVQALLPQIVVVNERTIGKRIFAGLRQRYLHTRVQLVRRKSAWADGALSAQRVKCWGPAPVASGYWIILTMEACPTHMTNSVIRGCTAHKILPHLVPGLMTHLLQPLNTHLFASFKGETRDRQERARLTSTDGSVNHSKAIRCWLDTTVARMSTRDFPEAFASVGLAHEQTRQGARCRVALAALAERWTPRAPDLPSLADFHALVETQRRLPLGWLFHRLVCES